MNDKLKPTETELEILNILWSGGPLSVKEVNSRMQKETGYTTTLKLLQLMYEKGLAGRVKEGRGHNYFAVVKEKEIKSDVVSRLISGVFGGSASRLVMQALGSDDTSPEEIKKIRDYLDKLDREDL